MDLRLIGSRYKTIGTWSFKYSLECFGSIILSFPIWRVIESHGLSTHSDHVELLEFIVDDLKNGYQGDCDVDCNDQEEAILPSILGLGNSNDELTGC